MRVYLPATLSLLRELASAGELPAPRTGFAVGPALREAYAGGNTEELEYVAFADAARASLRLLDADPLSPRRRAVVSADTGGDTVTALSDLQRSAVRVMVPIRLSNVVSVHLDGPEAVDDVRAAASAMLEAELGGEDAQFTVDRAEGHELAWYAAQELGPLLELWTD